MSPSLSDEKKLGAYSVQPGGDIDFSVMRLVLVCIVCDSSRFYIFMVTRSAAKASPLLRCMNVENGAMKVFVDKKLLTRLLHSIDDFEIV